MIVTTITISIRVKPRTAKRFMTFLQATYRGVGAFGQSVKTETVQ
jgi:hypothetical protein